MAWVEVYGGKRSLAFELTTAILWLEIHNERALGAMATMHDYASSQDSYSKAVGIPFTNSMYGMATNIFVYTGCHCE